MKKLTLLGMILTFLLGLGLWQQQRFVAKAAPMFATLTVTTTADSGAGSLRQAILDAAASGDTIVFDATVFATTQTITLTSGELVINKSLNIDGPGANQLTISGNNTSRVFNISSGVTVTLDSLTIANGRLSGGGNNLGGGINNSGTLTLTNSTLSGNSASGGINNYGGGIDNNGGTLTITGSTLSGNSASGGSSTDNRGGGIYSAFGTVTLTNSTLSGNSVSGGSGAGCQGGGISATGGTILTLTNSTLSGNSVSGGSFNIGGGIQHSASSPVKTRNTIIAGNSAATSPDVFGTFTSLGHNLIGNTSGATITPQTGDKFDANASPLNLGPLANNGGPTQTMALLPGSLAIDAGDNCVLNQSCASNNLGFNLTTDQRGITRPHPAGGTVDIGAYELACASVVTNTNDSGAGSLRQTIADACPNATITFDTAGVFATPQTILLTTGQLVINKSLTIQGPGASQLTVSGGGTSRVFSILSGNTVTLDGLTVTGGNATPSVPLGISGGGIHNEGTLTVSNCTVSGNSATSGGGITNSIFPSSLTLTNSTVSNNTAGPAGGGGILNTGAMTITHSSIYGNSLSGNGGGIASTGGPLAGPIIVTNSSVYGNTASNGGGFFFNGGTTLRLINSTVSGNSARLDGGGFGGQGSVEATNCTIIGNRADSDGDAFGSGGGFSNTGRKLNNTIVAGNFRGTGSTPDDIVGTIFTANNNLIGDAATSGGLTNGVNGNKVGFAVSAVLNTTLANNGGPTLTHALVPGSPALNAGSNALALDAANQPLTTDQRGTGFPRTIGSMVDVGAYEAACAMLVTNTNDSGTGSLRQTIADACPNATITFDTSGVFAMPQTILLTSGELVIDKSLTIDGPGASQLTVSGNNASRVFFIDTGNTATLDGLTVTGGNGAGAFTSGSGGGLYNRGTLTLTNSTVSGNSASGSNGGGIFNSGTLTATNSTVSGNSGGGGILNFKGTLTLTNSTVTGNSAIGGGGGIYSFQGTLTVTNCTVSGNSADGIGGGIRNGGGTLTVTNSTVTGNRADSDGDASGAGGGIVPAGTITLNNSIVAGNFRGAGSAPDDIDINSGTIDTANNNLIGDAATSGGIANGVNGNKVGFAVSAVLNTTLANNGGPTLTHALVCGSPAIDAGSSALALDASSNPLTTDQRGAGFPRTLDGNGDSTALVDIGAFEAVTIILPTISVSDVSLNEGNASTISFNFTVSLSQPAGACGVTFDIATQDNSATTAAGDYLQKAITSQTIPAGSSTYTFSVTVNGDLALEPDETFFVNLSNVTGATLGDGQGIGTITNDEVATVSISVTTSPAGLGITVDGTAYTSPQTFNWTPGSNHTIATTSPQSLATGTQAAFLNWSDSGMLSHSVTTPAVATTYTASFKTQYQLTTSASAGGTISPASGFYDAGSSININATANAGYTFSGFSGALTGTTNPQSLTLSAPATVNATFAGSTVFNFVGFFQPVDNLPTINSVTAGSSIPVKFSLTGYQGMAIFVAGFPASQVIACSSGTPDPIEETATAGSSGLSYDATTDRYTYVWKTEKAWKGTCRKLVVKFTDGTTREAVFQFR